MPIQAMKFTRILLLASLFGSTIPASGEEASWQIVNYWSEWCAPCRIEIPMFNALAEELAQNNVRVVGVNFDEDPRAVTLDIAEELGVQFYTLTLAESAALALRPPDVMPTTYILTPGNEVAAKLIGMQSREDILGKLIELGLELPVELKEP